jgi:hypothetical protein
MNLNFKIKKPKYYLDPNGEFTIENYNFAKPFANFFPGIAGKYGIPMWVFYVNRAQGIISFGTKDKDHPILEFLPANKAWQSVSLQGFRTFIKCVSGKQSIFYEPFHNGFANLDYDICNKMYISSSQIRLEEENSTLGLKINIEYFNIPNDSYAGLARVLTIKNLKKKPIKIQLLDGLPKIIPYGTSNLFLKKLSRTVEAWMQVLNFENNVPFYKLDVDPTDRPEIIHIKEGNFYLGFYYEKNKPVVIKPIVDPDCIFGPITDFSLPHEFLALKNFAFPKKQITESKTPCAFSLVDLTLPGKAEKSFYFVVGFATSLKSLNSTVKKIITSGYLSRKNDENKKVIEDLQQNIDTKSNSLEFDVYTKQTYLDNIMRGGYPVLFKTKFSESIFYLYSRKHGDLERDYNKFQLQDTYFSQGNGNYRDINQNRRCDVWFEPDIKDENLIYFYNLLQADGFNPLIVKGAKFLVKKEFDLKTVLLALVEEKRITEIISYLEKPFTPGDIVLFLEENKIKLKVSFDEFLNILLAHSIKVQEAEHGEGFWTDHWIYNLDLLENYLSIYPEKLKEIIFEKKCFTYYDNWHIVKSRAEKFQLYHGSPRQLQSVATDVEKKELITKRTQQPHVVRAGFGLGEIYYTTLINKLLCLFANKMASFDPFGVGIEMEANKPNWYDALNGLPAFFGSSLCETLELKRLILFIKSAFLQVDLQNISLTEEIHHFLSELNIMIDSYLKSNALDKDYQYWDKSYSLKEEYRSKTKLGLSGKESQLAVNTLLNILENALIKINSGINKAYDKKRGFYYSYFINAVKEFVAIQDNFIKPNSFIQRKLPLFLEGQVHALKLAQDKKEAKKIYTATKSSELYDTKLKMYKVTASLKSLPQEIGRCRAFTPGWLENESIWLHMEYKYLLEILKQELYEEFFAEFKNILIPFQKPQSYGRSILENSSFLVSSVFPDKNLHGNGFVARLSGSTAEFVQIWLTMNVGKNPFLLNDKNELNLMFRPILSGWLFDKNGQYSFNFLSKVRVVYHNPKRKNTFGNNAARIKNLSFQDKTGNPIALNCDTLPSPYAEQVRLRVIKRIDATLE